MKGLVRLCDLSPAGDKLIYWAAQYHASANWRGQQSTGIRTGGVYEPLRTRAPITFRPGRRVPRYLQAHAGPRRGLAQRITGTWTAISTPPYFSAVAIWPAFGHWTGGGVFLSPRDVRIYEPLDRMVPIERVRLPPAVRVRSYLAPTLSHVAATRRSASTPSRGTSIHADLDDAALARHGVTWVEFAHTLSETDMVFACDGRVYRLTGWRDVPADRTFDEAKLLVDLSADKFTLLEAPPEAMRW